MEQKPSRIKEENKRPPSLRNERQWCRLLHDEDGYEDKLYVLHRDDVIGGRKWEAIPPREAQWEILKMKSIPPGSVPSLLRQILRTDKGKLSASYHPYALLSSTNCWIHHPHSFLPSLHTPSKRRESPELCPCISGLHGWFPPPQFQVPSADPFWIAKAWMITRMGGRKPPSSCRFLLSSRHPQQEGNGDEVAVPQRREWALAWEEIEAPSVPEAAITPRFKETDLTVAVWWGTCIACVWLWVQFPRLQADTNKLNKEKTVLGRGYAQ